MTNKEIVAVFNDIATLLDLSGESPFKSRAYTNVARQIEGLEGDVSSLAAESRLREIYGVGDALEMTLPVIVDTGVLEDPEKLITKVTVESEPSGGLPLLWNRCWTSSEPYARNPITG